MVALGKRCPQLISIKLQDCYKITDTSELAKCSQLAHIDLCFCSNIEDAGVEALANRCPQLTRIDLSYCTKITDASVEALAKGCSQLTNINLGHCNSITGVGVGALGKGCPHLNFIHLPDCVNEAHVDALREKKVHVYVDEVPLQAGYFMQDGSHQQLNENNE